MSDRHVPAWVEDYLEAEYAPGGRGPLGFDCGGLVLHALREHYGVEVVDVENPGEAHEIAAQARADLLCGKLHGCERVAVEDARPGDILLIAPGRVATHVGIVVARARFLHALEGGGVAVERMDQRPWQARIRGVYRPRAGVPVAVGEVGAIAPILQLVQPIYSAFSSVQTAYQAFAPTIQAVAAGDYLRDSLFPPINRPDGNLPGQGRRDVSGFSNEIRRFESLPVHLGTLRFYPDFGAIPYYSISGSKLYQHHLFLLARNKINVSGLRNGDTPILSDAAVAYTGKVTGDLGGFEEVEFEIRQDFDPTDDSDATRLRLYPGRVEEESVNVTLKRGPSGNDLNWVTRRTPIDTTRVEVQIDMPQGLYGKTSTGQLRIVSVRLIAEYRKVGDANWTQFAKPLYSMANARYQRRALVVDLDKGQYDVRVRRVTGFIAHPQVGDVMQWSLFRTFGDGLPVALAGCTLMAVRVLHTNNLSGRLSTLNCIGTSVLNDWTGATWTERETSNPASAIRYVLQGAAGRRTIADSRIDLVQLQAFHERCDEAGFELNTRIVEREVAHDLLERIANVGRASYSLVDHIHTVAIDDPDDTTPVQVFTSRNILEGSFQGSLAYLDELHGVKVRFKDRDSDWSDAERTVYNDGYSESNATEFEVLDAWGVTSSSQAYKYGRWFLAVATLRRERFTVTVDFEHLRCVRGSPVRLAHPSALIGGAAGRITGVTTDGGGNVTAIEIDNAAVMQAGKTYEVRIRASDGDIVRRAVTTVAGDQESLTLSTSIAPAVGVAIGDLYLFGEYDSGSGLENSILCRVSSIRPGPNLTSQLILEPLAAEAHSADTGTIPNYNPQIQVPHPRAPRRPRLAQRLVRQGSTTATPLRRAARRGRVSFRVDVAGVSA